MTKYLFFLFLFSCIPNFSLSQIDKSYTVLNSIYPEYTDNNDLKSLDYVFENRKVIGMGESTHGTSEFTTMRHRFFKYLVENHGYNTFFLEADFGACQRLNRYIHGETDSVKYALNEVRLWPWLTQEMITLIEWMRVYNLNHVNKIAFVGCDMQLIKDDYLELDRFLKKVNHQDTFHLNHLNQMTYPFDTSLIAKEKIRWNQFNSTFKKNLFDSVDSLNYGLLKQSIDQWFDHNLSVNPNRNFRDSCMAVNIISYLKLNPESKGFYFAHNGHVSKRMSHNKNYPNIKMTGRFLFEELDTLYYTILQDCNQGKLNALNYKDSTYQFEIFDLESSNRKSISYYFNQYNEPILFSTNYPKKKKLCMTQIGALYGKNKNGHKILRYSLIESDYFDAYLFIQKTHETKLINSW